MLASVGVVILMACMNLITTSGQSDWERAEQADYAIVLGASVREDSSPSRIVGQRLQAAMNFMERNPTAMVILSGGQGGDEPLTEAQCMYDTLVSRGADPDRLVLETESHTARENLIHSDVYKRQPR